MDAMDAILREFGTHQAWKATENTWFISFMHGSQFMYLLEGNDAALLIDTGWGTGNLREFIGKLTDKKIIICNTHFHPDHAGGNGEWESAYVHENWELDAPSFGGSPLDISHLPWPNYEKKLIRDGFEIDLGGRKIKAIEFSAHSSSSLAYIDYENEMIFCGDEIEAGQVLLYNKDFPGSFDLKPRLKTHRTNTKKLLAIAESFHNGGLGKIMPAHNGAPISTQYLRDFIGLTDGIFAGTATIEEKLNHPYIEMDPYSTNIVRVRNGRASFFIEKDELKKVYGLGE